MRRIDRSLDAFQEIIGYKFSDGMLLESALTHPSFYRHKTSPYPLKIHFQRLEFLGDRLLSAVLGLKLFELFPEQREGFLSKAYMGLAQSRSLARIAQNLQIKTYLLVEQNASAESIICDAVEALIGAIWLDSHYDTATKCVLGWFGDIEKTVLDELKCLNYKGQLQELIGSRLHDIHYKLVKEWGPEHRRQFRTAVYLGEQLLSLGEGLSKQDAEEKAASLAIIYLKSQEKSSRTFD